VFGDNREGAKAPQMTFPEFEADEVGPATASSTAPRSMTSLPSRDFSAISHSDTTLIITVFAGASIRSLACPPSRRSAAAEPCHKSFIMNGSGQEKGRPVPLSVGPGPTEGRWCRRRMAASLVEKMAVPLCSGRRRLPLAKTSVTEAKSRMCLIDVSQGWGSLHFVLGLYT